MTVVVISPDITSYMEGGIGQINLKQFDYEIITEENLKEIMKVLHTLHPRLKEGLERRQRKPRIMCGCAQYTISI